jgi:hypothetical protein
MPIYDYRIEETNEIIEAEHPMSVNINTVEQLSKYSKTAIKTQNKNAKATKLMSAVASVGVASADPVPPCGAGGCATGSCPL